VVRDRPVESVGQLAPCQLVAAARPGQKARGDGSQLPGLDVVEPSLRSELPQSLADGTNLTPNDRARAMRCLYSFFATHTGRSAIGTWPFGHGLPLEFVSTQVWLT